MNRGCRVGETFLTDNSMRAFLELLTVDEPQFSALFPTIQGLGSWL